jgi:hypothetical protein
MQSFTSANTPVFVFLSAAAYAACDRKPLTSALVIGSIVATTAATQLRPLLILGPPLLRSAVAWKTNPGTTLLGETAKVAGSAALLVCLVNMGGIVVPGLIHGIGSYGIDKLVDKYKDGAVVQLFKLKAKL